MPINSDRNVANQWWRWPLMPIAAILGGIAGSAAFALIQWLGIKLQGGYSEDGWMLQYVLPALTSGAFGWLFVYISCAVAPRGKIIAGTVMTTLLVLTGIANLLLVWGFNHYAGSEAVRLTISSVVASGAGIASLIQAHQEYRH